MLPRCTHKLNARICLVGKGVDKFRIAARSVAPAQRSKENGFQNVRLARRICAHNDVKPLCRLKPQLRITSETIKSYGGDVHAKPPPCRIMRHYYLRSIIPYFKEFGKPERRI